MPLPPLRRIAPVVGAVLLMHGALLWALQQGLVERAVESVVPARIITQIIQPPAPPAPAPRVEPTAPAAPPPKPVERARGATKPAEPPRQRAVTPPAPRPPILATASPSAGPAPLAPASVPASPAPVPALPAPVPALPAAEPAPAPVAAAPAAPVAPPAPAAPPAPPAQAAAPRIVQPSSSAAYLNNPPPPYPPMSRRLGETGRVVVRVQIGADGTAQAVQLQKSSGFDRLDQVALETVRQWRYKPGTRDGVAETMWFNVPVNFELTP